jgi:hypothetical protein
MRTSSLVALTIGLGIVAGCSHRTTTIRERTITQEPRIREERTVVVPAEPTYDETTVIKKERREYEEED